MTANRCDLGGNADTIALRRLRVRGEGETDGSRREGVAEGDERGTNKESLRFLFIARVSLGELETQLWIGQDIGWIEPDAYRQLSEKRADVARLLGGLIRMRQQRLKASET